MNRFWDLETIGIREKEDWNLHDLQDSIYFSNEGRYAARLPLKESYEIFKDNYSLCEKRLLKLYNKLKNDTVPLKNCDISVEQSEAGIIETV